MAGLNLRGDTSGSVEIVSPAVAGDNTITLPNDNGSANQFFKNSTTAGIVTHSSMIEDASGNIGIGTDNPQTHLEIVSDNITQTSITSLGDDSAIRTTRLDFNFSDGSGAGIAAKRAAGVANTETYLSIRTGGATNNDEKIRIESNGNVGINETSPENTLHVKGGGIAITNAGSDHGTYGAAWSDSDGDLNLAGYNVNLLTGSNNARTSRVTVNQNGNTGIGTDSPARPLHIESTLNNPVRIKSSATYSRIEFSSTTSTDPQNVAIGAFGDNFRIFTGTGGSNSTRMEVNSSGNVNFGTTTSLSETTGTITGATFYPQGILGLSCDGDRALFIKRLNSNGDVVTFRRDNTVVGNISVTASATSYNESSDHRLKENVVNITDGIVRVKQLQPRRFNFIADADTTVDGFIAHEAQTVVPEAVTGTHNEVDEDGNAVMQGIDKSKFVPLLTAALQEAIAKIETLETKVAALEGN